MSTDGTFVPWIHSLRGAKSPRTFAPWNCHTRGTFAPEERMSQELPFPGTFAYVLKKIGGGKHYSSLSVGVFWQW